MLRLGEGCGETVFLGSKCKKSQYELVKCPLCVIILHLLIRKNQRLSKTGLFLGKLLHVSVPGCRLEKECSPLLHLL